MSATLLLAVVGARITADELAQLMLDPSFRTRIGFIRLIVKEWLDFGHQMALRCGTIAPLDVRCHPADALPEGVNAHYGRWDWARVPCPPAQGANVGDFCPVRPRDHFSFCSFPWVVPPRIRAAALERAVKERLKLAKPLRRRRRGKGKGRGRLNRARKAAMDNIDV